MFFCHDVPPSHPGCNRQVGIWNFKGSDLRDEMMALSKSPTRLSRHYALHVCQNQAEPYPEEALVAGMERSRMSKKRAISCIWELLPFFDTMLVRFPSMQKSVLLVFLLLLTAVC